MLIKLEHDQLCWNPMTGCVGIKPNLPTLNMLDDRPWLKNSKSFIENHGIRTMDDYDKVPCLNDDAICILQSVLEYKGPLKLYLGAHAHLVLIRNQIMRNKK